MYDSPTPLFDGAIIRAGTHINAVGRSPFESRAYTGTVVRSRVIIDAGSAADKEAGGDTDSITEGAIQASHVKGTLARLFR